MSSLQHAAVVSLQIQDAVNLSGVVLEFNEILRETMWPEARKRGLGADVNGPATNTVVLREVASAKSVD